MRRTLLGLLALVLLASGLTGLALYGTGEGRESMLSSICLRIGLVLGALWLALPQLQRLRTKFPPWLIGAVVLGLVLLVTVPRAIVALLPLVAIGLVIQFLVWLFKPLPPRRSRSQRSTESDPSSGSRTVSK